MADIADNADNATQQHLDVSLGKRVDPSLASGVKDCTDCDEPIPPKRLEIYPAATRCVECEIDFQKRTKMGGRS